MVEKYKSTGVVQWMLNNAWPSLIWHLFDYYYNQGGSYYGVKKALEPIHIMYDYNNPAVWVVNNRYKKIKHLEADLKLYDVDGEMVY